MNTGITIFGATFAKRVARFARLVAMSIGVLAIASCGGGEGGSTPSPGGVLNFSGTVAVGAALQNVVVSVSCKDGATGRSSPTDSAGQYALSIRASLPCTFQAIEPVTGFVFRSLTDVDGTVNISPLSEMVFVFANGDTAKLVEAKAKLSSLMSGIGSNLEGDPLRTPFAANETGLDKNILDLVEVSSLSSGTISNPYAGLRTVNQALTDGTCLVAPGTGTTFDQTGRPIIPIAVCPKLAVHAHFSQTFTPEVAAIAVELFDAIGAEIDRTLWPAIKGYSNDADWNQLFSEVHIEIQKRYIQYVIGNLISSLKPSDIRSLAKRGVPMVKKIGKELTSKALGQFGTFKKGDLLKIKNIQGIFAGAIGSLVNDEFQDWLISTPLAEYASNIENQSLGGVAAGVYGVAAYGVDVLTDAALVCRASLGSACVVSLYVAIPLDTIKWISKDIAAIEEITKVRSSVRDGAVENSVRFELQTSISSYDELARIVLVTWAKGGATSDIRNLLAGQLSIASALIDQSILFGERAAICTGLVFDGPCNENLDPTLKVLLKQQNLTRLDKMRQRFENYASACTALQKREGEIGISKCLNLINHNSSAPLACEVGLVLTRGECVAPKQDAKVTSANAVNATVGSSSAVVVSGTNLPLTAVLSVQDATCQLPTGNTINGFSQVCTYGGPAGTKTITVKTNTNANGGMVIDSTNSVVVTAAPVTTPGVIVVPPPTATIVIPATAFVRGINVALFDVGYGTDTLGNAPPYGSVANAAEWDIVIPRAGKYEFFANYSAALSRPVTISFNGVGAFTNAMSATTGGWFSVHRQAISQGVVTLPAGAVTMRVARGDVFPHIQGFTLVPVVP